MPPLVPIPYFKRPLFASPDNLRLADAERRLVPTLAPTTPSKSSYNARAKTFKHYNFVTQAKGPRELVQAGLFLADSRWYEDLTVCHWCGICLMRWEPHDVAIEVHLQSRPDCLFARKLGPSIATEEMFDRWRSVSICQKIIERGLSLSALNSTLNYIFKEHLAFPQTLVCLYELVLLVNNQQNKDVIAGNDDIKCAECENQAIISYVPCGHVSSCLSCSNEKHMCEMCGVVVTGRIVVHLA